MENNGNKSCSHGSKHSSKGSRSMTMEKKSTESSNSEQQPIFVNHAEIAWNQRRKEWTGDQSHKSKRVPREPIMSWTTTYEELLVTTTPFQQPIPLTEMVDFLVDTWHEEGLYD